MSEENCVRGRKPTDEEVFRSYRPLVYRVANRMLGDSGECADVTQDVFLKVFRNIRGFRGDSSLKTWICRIAFSEVLNKRRSWKRRSRSHTVTLDHDFMDHGPSPYQILESKERKAAIQWALDNLSGERRSILVLRGIEDLSYGAIAKRLGISMGTVKSRLARARSDMRRLLEGDQTADYTDYAD